MGKKKKVNPFLKILGVLFVVFIALFIASQSGYYESQVRDKVVITEEKIKEFESLIQNGEEIDINDFLDNEREDYSSSMSHLGDNLTSGISNAVSVGMDIVTDILKSLF